MTKYQDNVIYEDSHKNTQISSELSKRMMGYIRGGDYQHPGGEEAIDFLFEQTNNHLKTNLCLDVGCGLGGTANYIHKKKWGRVVGIDINEELVSSATEKYSSVLDLRKKSIIDSLALNPIFIHDDAHSLVNLSKILDGQCHFDIVYMFNSFFLFKEKILVLNRLRNFSNKGTKVYIFDYVDNGMYAKNALCENNNKILPYCIKKNEINEIFDTTGWHVTKVINMDNQFLLWYQDTIKKMNDNNMFYKLNFGEETFKVFYKRYRHIYESMECNLLGGAIICASIK